MGRKITRLERPITRLTVYLREGRPVIVRLTPDGLRFRRKYERRWYPLSWEQAWLLAQENRAPCRSAGTLGPLRRLGESPLRQEVGMSQADLAYRLWELAGRPNGRDQDFWLQAGAMLSAYQQLAEAIGKADDRGLHFAAPSPAVCRKAPGQAAAAIADAVLEVRAA